MGWNDKYWDLHDQLYWSPRYLGLTSIPRNRWRRSPGWVSVSVEDVNATGPLYRRVGDAATLHEQLLGQEEILNHFFDLMFAIAPDLLISEILLSPLGFSDQGPFTSIGREVRTRYRWGRNVNLTQQDGLFVGPGSVVGVELKLKASSSPGQIVKYAALATWEEIHSGKKSEVGLLFILPAGAISGHWRRCGLSGPEIDPGFTACMSDLRLPQGIRKLIDYHPDEWSSVLSRLKLAAMSWSDLQSRLQRVADNLDQSRAGDQTLYRLIDGFLAQLKLHRDTGIDTGQS